jgi:hypothetical protein
MPDVIIRPLPRLPKSSDASESRTKPGGLHELFLREDGYDDAWRDRLG